MKKNKITLTRTGEQYTCKYLLDTADIVDTKVDMGMSGRFPQIIPCNLVENGGQREFVYTIGSRTQMTEFLKKEINKKQMLTLLYNVLDALETFGMNMISLSYVAKDIQYLFVNPETLDVSFIVAAVDRETTDLNEVRNFVKDIICNATYFEMDKDNYVAKLITFANKRGTFSVNDMKKYVENMLLEMGIHIEDEKKKAEKTEKAASGKVSRVGVMQNNAKMMPPQGQPMPPQMGANGQPMQGRPMPPQMGPNGQPMQGRPVPPQMGPDGKPMQGRPVPPQMGPNGQPMQGRPMPPQMGPDGKPIQGQPVPPMTQEKPETPVAPMTQEKPETPAAPVTQEKPETPAAPVTQEKPQAPVPYLLRVSTNEKIYINKPEFTIGRSATKADYTVDNNSDVSRIHCIIERKNGVSYIRDNQSTNGTFVNGNNIAGQENVFLTNNAKVSLGDESFIYFVK